MPGAFRAVFLDVGGTLIEIRQPYEAYYEVLRGFGCEATLDEVKEWLTLARAHARTLPDPVGPDYRISLERQTAYRNAMLDHLICSAGLAHRLADCRQALYDSWLGTRIFGLHGDVVGTLSALKAAGLIVAAVSNWEARLAQLLATHRIHHYFDFILASEAEGHAKPGPRLFELALARVGVQPHEVLHVGDSVENDVQPAEALGIRTVFIKRKEADAPGHSPRIHSLEPVATLATARVFLRGVVESGKGEAASFTAIPWVERQVRERLGFTPHPGTLNLHLTDRRDLTAWHALRSERGVPLEPSPGYCAARCYPVVIEGQVAGAIVYPLVAAYPPDVVELLAPLPLRQRFELSDGAWLSLAVT